MISTDWLSGARRRLVRRCLVLIALECGLVVLALERDAGSQTVGPALVSAVALDGFGALPDPARVVTERACVDCHKSEIQAWMKTHHYQNRDMLRTEPKAKEFAEALGVSLASLTVDSLCVRCHGLSQTDESGHTRAVSGVSCESCHGAAGGVDGWLNPHGSYAAPDITREMETAEHRTQRIAQCEAAGMVRPARIYQLAKNCLGCHIIGNEKLVNAAGHPSASEFSMVAWSQGEVRHNFHLDQTTNAEAPSLWTAVTGRSVQQRRRMMFVLGLLAEFETSLRNRAAATEGGTFLTAMAGRASAAGGQLLGIAASGKSPELTGVQMVYNEVLPLLFVADPANTDKLKQAAEKVSELARQFEATYDGSEFPELDGRIPQPTTFKGDVFQP